MFSPHISIHEPAETSSIHDESLRNVPQVLVYLPSGLSNLESFEGHNINPSALAAAAKLPMININYRLSSDHRYPIPLWDVLVGYEWIVKHYLKRAQEILRLGIYGSHIGGSLALALGLTECRLAQGAQSDAQKQARVVSVATSDAITDWPRLAPLGYTVGEKVETVPPQHDLEQLRSSLFHETRMRDAFDPFISPALFFRTPGVEVPLRPSTPPPPIPDRSPNASETASPMTGSLSVIDEPKDASLSRVYARRFPPTSMGPVILPHMQLSATRGTIYETQNVELAKFIHRAMIREAISSGTGQKMVDEISDDTEAEALKAEQDESHKQAKQDAERRCRLDVSDEGGMDVERLARFFMASSEEKP